MTAPAVDRSSPASRQPLLSVFAVRAELEPFANIRHFDQEIDAAIEHTAATGSFDRLHAALRTWLGITLVAKSAAEHVRVLFEQRGDNQERLIRA